MKNIKIFGKKKDNEKDGFSTVDDIIDDILKTLPLEYQEKVKEMTADEFRYSQHHKLGMTIKDKYYYKNESRDKLIKIYGDKKDDTLPDCDSFSRMILEKLYEKITTEKTEWETIA